METRKLGFDERSRRLNVDFSQKRMRRSNRGLPHLEQARQVACVGCVNWAETRVHGGLTFDRQNETRSRDQTGKSAHLFRCRRFCAAESRAIAVRLKYFIAFLGLLVYRHRADTGAAHAFAQPLFNQGKTYDPIAAETAWMLSEGFLRRRLQSAL